jgi:type VI secretion system protein VasJ
VSAEPPSSAAVPSDAPPGGTEPAGSGPPTEAVLLRWAGRLLDEDPTDPRSYRLLRLLRWDPISRTPPHEKTRTSLPAPTPSRREALQRLFDAGNDALFLEQAEAAFQQPPFHFWLDLQHLLCKTLNRAGPSFLSAHDAVRTEILRLFHRFPALLDLQFSDDTPFARPETKRWITQQPALSPPGALSSSSASTDASATGDPATVAPATVVPETDAVGSALSTATDRLSRDGLAAALQHLQDASSDRSARTRFRVRLGMAALCMEDGAPRLAYPLLQSLAAEGRRRNLDRWNPDLLADVWTHLFRCCRDLADRSGSRSNSDDERDAWLRAAEAARGRVCALSPDRALSLFSSRDDPSAFLPGTMQGTEIINRIASST